MTSIVGIPTTRISDLFVRQRLLSQVQFDQKELFRLQAQLSTGRQFELPGEEPVASLRVMSLQRLLEQKEQIQANLTTNQSFLSMTDVAMSRISGFISDARGAALGAIGTVATDEQRLAAAQQIQEAITSLVDAGNQEYRGRFLFAGSESGVRPFQYGAADTIEYFGNEGRIQSYSDVDMLFNTNATGSEVFGAISQLVRGSVDLDPVLTFNTRLADLRGGQGISEGSIAISDGTNTSIVDLTNAETLGDVAALIRDNPPLNRMVQIDVNAAGLTLWLDSGPGDLTIREVGGGTTAAELGILRETGIGNVPVVGGDLDPIVRKTTRLDDIIGSRATAVLRTGGTDNDILLEADSRGAALNGVTITFVDDPAVTAGNEVVTYNAALQEIEVRVDEYLSRAHHVVQSINDAHDLAVLPFTASLDPLDAVVGGQGFILATPAGDVAGTTAGGTGTDFDQDSGLQIVNGNETHTIDFAAAETVEDLLNLLNGSKAGVLAEINDSRTGINVRSRVSGADFAIGENGGTTATQLGLRTFTSQMQLEDLGFGLGVSDYQGPLLGGAEFTITRADGVAFDVDITGAQTVGDVIDRINTHPDNLVGVPLVARLATFGNGIELVDDTGGAGTLTLTMNELSDAAIELGLVPKGATDSTGTPAGGGSQVLTGTDAGTLETEGIFTSLARLKQGLETNDLWTMNRALEMLDEQVVRMNFSRAEIGTRQKGLEVQKERLDVEEIELRKVLSKEYDADLVEVISNLNARQVALEAGLTATARILQLSLLDYM